MGGFSLAMCTAAGNPEGTEPMTAQHPESVQVSVVVPTYQRPDALVECVRSLLAGAVLPSEIIVVGRADDESTRQVVPELCSTAPDSVRIRSDWVTQPGHIPPVEAGVRLASGHIIAIVDDDVTVSRGWLEAVFASFADPTVGVVSGPAIVPGSWPGKLKGKPGCLTWYGRAWGNLASLQVERAVEVDTVLEGNCAWRGDLLRALRIDPLLNFDDACMYGLDLCLEAKAAGFRVLYEPRANVLHHTKPRAPELDRAYRPARVFSYCRNHTYIMLKRLSGWRKAVFLVWWFGMGERVAVGIGVLIADALTGRKRQRGEAGRAFAGRIEGIRLWLRARTRRAG
jgi:GT2 family glycosyltransferase